MATTLSPEMIDRAHGALIGTAVGDALGVPYEFALRLSSTAIPQMLGGGLGDFAPGEWSDDTSMMMAVARAGAAHGSLTDQAALDDVARGFLDWYGSNPPDIGNQTRAVLRATAPRLVDSAAGIAETMLGESRIVLADKPRAAGNGALMRTAPVALAHLDDRDGLAAAARAVASLTHAHHLAGDSCVLWSESIRVAISEGELHLDAGLDLLPDERRDWWAERLAEACDDDPRSFNPNGYTVHAFQAAASSVAHAEGSGGDHFADGVFTAVRIGDDTDTVAAITGALLGARWGQSAIADDWQQQIHGWPVVDGVASRVDDLVEASDRAVGQ